MNGYIGRSCTLVAPGDDQQLVAAKVEAWRSQPAYVLLGEPGMGKTTVFKQEAQSTGGRYVTASDFLAGADTRWQGERLLFIDGLDEKRAAATDARQTLDDIRLRLEGVTQFRLSCREADWFGERDYQRLASLVPEGDLVVLRLNSLTDEDIHSLLENLKTNNRLHGDPGSFMATARKHAIADLLNNPLTLNLLVEALDGGVWPSSRAELFSNAIRQLLKEVNHTYYQIKPGAFPYPVEDLRTAAGELCALTLLTGKDGLLLAPVSRLGDYLPFGSLSLKNRDMSVGALKTNLFRAGLSDQSFVPHHRQIAEYLAAEYLAGLLKDQRLPFSRVVTLFSARDGAPVTELRGMTSWLAVLNPTARQRLIRLDPLGLLTYGDVRQFSPEDKLLLIDALKQQAQAYAGFHGDVWERTQFGALATPDMEGYFDDLLTTGDHSPAAQSLMDILIDALRFGDVMPALIPALVSVIENSSWWSGTRVHALDVVIRYTEQESGLTELLISLLNRIHQQELPDERSELRGRLLAALYPAPLAPAELVRYLVPPAARHHLGRYERFLTEDLVYRSKGAQLADLLDELSSAYLATPKHFQDSDLREMFSRLIPRGVTEFGLDIETDRLYQWLSVAVAIYPYTAKGLWSDGEGKNIIKVWFEAHPQRYLDIVGLHLRLASSGTAARRLWQEQRYTLHAARPPNFGGWCLHQLARSNEPDLKNYLLVEAYRRVGAEDESDDFTLELIRDSVTGDAALEQALAQLVSPPPEDEDDWERQQQRRTEQEQAAKQHWLAEVRAHFDSHQPGQVAPALLHDLARAYFGGLHHAVDEINDEDRPIHKLSVFMGADQPLVDAALASLAVVWERSGLPDVEELFELDQQGKVSTLAYPMLVALELDPLKIHAFSEQQCELAAALWLLCGVGDEPLWFQPLRHSPPDWLARLVIRVIKYKLGKKEPHIGLVYDLAGSDHYQRLADKVLLPLLKSFPLRAASEQLTVLEELLFSAVGLSLKSDADRACRSSLLKLIQQKLARKSLTVEQQSYWLAAGLLVEPERYLTAVEAYLAVDDRRARQFARCLHPNGKGFESIGRLSFDAQICLIRYIGRQFAPYVINGGEIGTPEMGAADLVRHLISNLNSATTDADQTLACLESDPELVKWKFYLQRARWLHQREAREQSFTVPTAAQVVATLANGAPANSADLQAIVVEKIDELAGEIRDGNTNDYKQYWSGTERFKPEEECRDLLLSDLKKVLLPLDIDALPEGTYADNKRADIRVKYVQAGANYEVPIEIKKNNHRKLWSAVENQLVKKYTREPTTAGRGIYLVLWFGQQHTQRAPDGSRPVTPEELAEKLTASLSPELRNLVAVRVIDVSLRGEVA